MCVFVCVWVGGVGGRGRERERERVSLLSVPDPADAHSSTVRDSAAEKRQRGREMQPWICINKRVGKNTMSGRGMFLSRSRRNKGIERRGLTTYEYPRSSMCPNEFALSFGLDSLIEVCSNCFYMRAITETFV